MIFEVRDVRYRYKASSVDAVSDVSLSVDRGELVAVVGPNGSGKTTLVRLLAGTEQPAAGYVGVMGKPLTSWGRKDLAKALGVVAQREEPVFPVRVRQQVQLGRFPHLGTFGVITEKDHEVVDRALRLCDVSHLADRWVATLSGGEWQRVRIARTLAQEPAAMILDEPTANLDIRHEMEVFELVHQLVKAEGMSSIVITHHVNLAARFSDRIVVMHEGKAAAVGEPNDVLTRETLEGVFEWPVDVVEWDGAPQFIPRKRS